MKRGVEALSTYDCTDPAQREEGIAAATSAVRAGDLVVLPTDTVYGIGADAFSPIAVSALLNAKRRGRNMPPPVLVGTVAAAKALVEDLGPDGVRLTEELWPGGLTLVLRANRSLVWDLGETKGTVAVRMPDDEVALELLSRTGPMAVSSANLTGNATAATAAVAERQLGEAIEVYLDGGVREGGVGSSIVDLTGPVPVLLRAGSISVERLREVVDTLVTDDDPIEDVTDEDEPAAGDDGPARGAVTGSEADADSGYSAEEAEEAEQAAYRGEPDAEPGGSADDPAEREPER